MTDLRIDPPAFLTDPALQAVLAAIPSARIVGGAVRDAIAGHPVADIDLATPEPPEHVVRALHEAGLKHAPTGLQHGTVTAISGHRGFEITTLRTDERTDGRHADVAWTTDWQQDAARRDFTINAMSLRPDGCVSDYFGGIEDLRQGRLRFVGDPVQRIAEDYLRVLRFFRFYARYATTPPDPATCAALRDAKTELGRLSVERVWSELKRILAAPAPLASVELMQQLGILDAVLCPGPDLPALARLIEAGAPPDPLLRLVALDPEATALAERFKLSNAEAAILAGLAGSPPDPAWDDDALRRALVEAPADSWAGRAWLHGGDAPPWPELRARLHDTRRPVFRLHGRDALALGIPPGPRIGDLLGAVRSWWLAQGCRPDEAACRAELARLVQA